MVASSCSHDWDLLDPRIDDGGSSVATTSASASSGGGATTSSAQTTTTATTTGSGGATTSSGSGGGGGAPGWLAPDHLRRRVLTVTNEQSVELEGFPLMIALDDSRIDYGVTQSSGDDLRFFDEAGSPVDYEIERWDPAATSHVWLRAPSLAANTVTSFSMYYGHSGATPAQAPAAVWVDYAAVWHMDASLGDSTGNHPGSDVGTSTADGVVGAARTFDGATSHVDVTQVDGLNGVFAGGATVSAWIHPTGWGGSGFGRVMDRSSGGTGQTGWLVNLDEADTSFGFRRDFTTTGGNWGAPVAGLSLDAWQLITVVYEEGGDASFFVDGAPLATTVTTTPAGTPTAEASTPMCLGNRATAYDRGFAGRLDEVRIVGVPRSAAWIAAQHASMLDQMVSYGVEETQP
jgi:hypothetical protein